MLCHLHCLVARLIMGHITYNNAFYKNGRRLGLCGHSRGRPAARWPPVSIQLGVHRIIVCLPRCVAACRRVPASLPSSGSKSLRLSLPVRFRPLSPLPSTELGLDAPPNLLQNFTTLARAGPLRPQQLTYKRPARGIHRPHASPSVTSLCCLERVYQFHCSREILLCQRVLSCPAIGACIATPLMHLGRYRTLGSSLAGQFCSAPPHYPRPRPWGRAMRAQYDARNAK